MKSNVILSTTINIEVPFHDCDPMHIVWHGNYPRYFEVARCQLLRLFNYDYLDMVDSGFSWPIIDMRVKYVGSAKFAQHITVKADLVEYEHRLKINYLITDRDSGAKLTKGFTIQAAIDMEKNELQLESPPILFKKLSPFLSDTQHD